MSIPSKLAEALKEKIEGEVLFDPVTLSIYSQDASIFEVKPLGVVIPKNTSDLVKTVQLAAQFSIPLIARGSGTGITGGCLGQGIILDTSKYLNQILEIDEENFTALCEPGVIQDQLNNKLLPLGYRLGPDTSTGDRATMGGMLANNAAGARSLYFGAMKDAIEEVTLVLSNGEVILIKSLNESEWNAKLSLNSQEGQIYRTLHQIRNEHAALIQERLPKIPRRSSGYLLSELIDPFPLNVAQLIAGSEGTLGIVSSLKVKIVPLLPETELHLFSFDSIIEAMESVEPILKTQPIAFEMIDDTILHAGISSPLHREKLSWIAKIPKALLIVEYPKGTQKSGDIQIQDPKAMQHIWEVRKAGLGLLLSKRSYSRAVAFIEDIAVPPTALVSFMEIFESYLKKMGKQAGIYGHVGPGCLHIRPYMDLRDPGEVKLMKRIMKDVSRMIKDAGGALSGEHGDGLIRSWLNPDFFGQELYRIFEEVKQAFDPKNLMNPHKIIDPISIDNHLRKPPKSDPKTFLKFQGGLALSADLCNGNGACRKNVGVMCPSFQVTHDEYDSTRGRANYLRSLLQQEKPVDFSDPGLHDILDLCIQCKGCKVECPSAVDMAKMKSEALYQRQEKEGYSLRNLVFAHIDTINKWSFPSIFNWISGSYFGKKILLRLGIVPSLPLLSPRRFSKAVGDLNQPEGPEVLLLSDTYTEFYCSEIGLAAVSTLNALGFRVIVPPWSCCGRPALSKGVLKHAKNNALHLSHVLKPYMIQKIPIIGLEPSCFFTLFDEYHDLLGSDWNPESCIFFDNFVAAHASKFVLKEPLQVALHRHCHEKAAQTLQLLKDIKELEVLEIPSGCCGMAGSFGYEREHAAFSKSIAALRLVPYIQSLAPDIPIIASGFSCRMQIKQETGRQALHLAEWLKRYAVCRS